ncbi:DUF2264 domain-containing protein [Plantibacter sp. Mn2098]|uniref:DUF2264 domain-containing protein n=1 Tax=Plantibacter sp. Mn2098 TaxID=3395266 RepID=UPI003BC0DD18
MTDPAPALAAATAATPADTAPDSGSSAGRHSPFHGPIDRFAASFTRVDVPAEDRELSPYTGLTRAHWVAAADDLLLSAARFASPGGSRLDLPGKPSQQGVRTDGIEGFARTFLLAAFLHVGNRGVDPHGHLARYVRGVVAGTKHVGVDDADSWPIIDHIGRDGQPHVEAASIALSLHLTREASWETLAADEQDRVVAWLRNAIDKEPSSNNWYLFPLTIASFLEGVGRADEQTSYVIERGLALIEEWYRGDGWYSDGDGEAFDHYIGWALHLYPLLHARLRGEDALAAKLTPRLELFLETFARTFDRNGAPIYMGRSMTYRMGTLAAIAMGEVTGATPLTHGQSRRILSADLRYFFERDATTDGILTLGWHGEHEPTVQRYSGPGSPYWTSKGFAALLLPDDHPVWTAVEEPLEADTADYVQAVDASALIIQSTAVDGIVRVHNHGSDHIKPHQADAGAADPLYGRFAYSTRTGPTALHNVTDNDLQVNVRGVWSVRRRVHHVASGDGWMASWHAPRFTVYGPFDASPDAVGGPILPSARIETVVAVRGAVEVRIHRLRGIPPRSRVRLAGWAVAAARPEELVASAGGAGVVAAAVELAARRQGQGPGAPVEWLRSDVVGVVGWTGSSTSAAQYGTAFGSWAVVPELTAASADGALPTTILVALARLTGDASASALADAASVTVVNTTVSIDWLDGTVPTAIDLDALPWPTRL